MAKESMCTSKTLIVVKYVQMEEGAGTVHGKQLISCKLPNYDTGSPKVRRRKEDR